ncbi:MAG: hypothetical protein JXA33_17025 [Anaerolineae bacterium]|nr:hypothetical protein [Anaerolineae bacterium]
MTQPLRYQIRVRGHLSEDKAYGFSGFTLKNEPNGDTVLSGLVLDQSALHGIFNRIRDLGLVLVAVQCMDDEISDVKREA